MRTSLVFILSLIFSVAAAQAQTASDKIPKAKPVEEKKPGFFKRVFSKKDKAEEAKPAPTPEPKPKATPRPRTRTAPKPAPKDEAAEPKVDPPADTRPAPAPDKPKTMPPAEKPKPAVKAESKPPEPKKPEYADKPDAEKYQAVRKLALEDEKIQALAAKAGEALAPAEAKEATDEYNRALFRKIRQIEPSLDAYVDRVEAAMTKRLATERKK